MSKTKYNNFLVELGAKKLEHKHYRFFTHVLKTYIGDLYLKIDTDGPVLSLIGNFLNDIQEAKKHLGHWKYNLHEMKKGNTTFEMSIKRHLEAVI